MRLIPHRACRQRTRYADDIGCKVTGIFQKLLTSYSVESKGFVDNRNWSVRELRRAVDFGFFRGLSKLFISYWSTLKPTSESRKVLVWACCNLYPRGLLIPVFKDVGFIPRVKIPH